MGGGRKMMESLKTQFGFHKKWIHPNQFTFDELSSFVNYGKFEKI